MKTFELKKPVDGITQIDVDEPTVAEIARLTDDSGKFGGIRATANLIAAQSKHPTGIILQLCARDFKAIEKYYIDFLQFTPEEIKSEA